MTLVAALIQNTMNYRLFIAIGLALLSAKAVLAAGPTEGTAAANAVRVACIGDSITFGHSIADREHKSYPAVLAKRLGTSADVRNFGVNGATALKRGTRPYSDQKAYHDALKFKPQFVVIMLGTNDTNKNSWPDHHDEFAADYSAIVDSFRAANPAAQIWLCLPPPLFRDRRTAWDTDAILKDQIVPTIREVARQKKCNVIDVYSLFANEATLFADGVHPNAQGAQQLADAIGRELAPRLKHERGNK
jgi:sialate O-acetylesterase